MTNGAVDQAVEATQDAAEIVLDRAESAEGKVLDAVDSVQETIGKATPVSTDFDVVASPSDVKSRLDWGEPALTILDVRDREAFNRERIMGAMTMPMSDLSDKAEKSLSLDRDIYIYGDSDNDASAAAMKLSDAGFKKVSVLRGGLPAWKAIDGPVEGQIQGPGALD
ncbi:MAG: rhodanese-like domain-containing protein [Cyanobacteria bacterium J06623_4]